METKLSLMSFNTAQVTLVNTLTFSSTITVEPNSMLTLTASLLTLSTLVFLDALTLSASESVLVPVPLANGLNPVLTLELPLPELLPSRLDLLDALPFSTGPKDHALLAMPPSTLRSTLTEDGKLSLLAAMLTMPNKVDSNKLTLVPFPRLI